IPYGYSPDPELRGVRPLPITPLESQPQQKHIENNGASFHTPVSAPPRVVSKPNNASLFNKEEFPPLGAMNASRQRR
nr:oxoglutarate/iron-dependent dioxygenase [Tanacetum cinerariifolium]